MVTGWNVSIPVVDRPALRARLDGSLGRPLALLVAQAGAGKTVLLSQWEQHHPELQFVWIDIVEYDNDPAHLAGRLLSGLAALKPGLAALARLVRPGQAGFGELFLEALAARLGELPPAVIVFDDLHHVTNPAVIEDLVWLVDRVPSQVHLVISTRVDLPLSWIRHRLHDDVTEIRGADLAFDIADSTLLLENISGRALTQQNVGILVKRTEGWAAGLQLAALTLKRRDDTDEFVEQFSGTDRLIADYLGGEVLNAQPGPLRRALLLASGLDEMCGELLATVTGESHTRQFFETLERESLFLVPLDSHREWFRFHQLFRDLLRYHLRAEDPEAERLLLTRAARWHLERGEINRAVEYLLRAKDWDSALELIRARGAEVYERNEMRTVIGWITELPPAAVPDRLDVTLLLGVLRALEGQMVIAEDILRRVLIHPDASEGQRLVAYTMVAARAQWSSHPEASADMAAQAITLLEEHPAAITPDVLGITDRSSLMTLALLSGGRSHFLSGNLAEARRWLKRALASDGAGFVPWRVGALGSLALVEAWGGRTQLAGELAAEALGIADEGGLSVHSATADAHLAMALVAQERAEILSASRSLREGGARAAANGRTQLMWVEYLLRTRIREAQGVLQRLPPPGGPPPSVVRDRLRAFHRRTRRLHGTLLVAQIVETDGRLDSMPVRFERVAGALTLRQPDYARALLDAAPKPSADELPIDKVERLILHAWLASVEGRTIVAQRTLAEALDRAQANELIDAFLRAGPAVIDLLQRLPGPTSDFHLRILERARIVVAVEPSVELPDPLTHRELEILACLPSRSTNTELAQSFFISVNTVKTHMTHIYQKLDVPNRNNAIVRARELGLLPVTDIIPTE